MFDQMMLNQELVVEPSKKAGHYDKSQMAKTSYSNRKVTIHSSPSQVDNLPNTDHVVTSGDLDKAPKPSLTGRMLHTMHPVDYDRIVVDGLTLREAMERLNREEGY